MKRLSIVLGVCTILWSGCGKPTADEYLERGREAYERAQKAADSLGGAANLSEIFRESVELYSSVRKEYSGTPQAGEALFMLATIRNNNLHEIPTAIELYRQYVDENPDGSKAPVALFMMGYLYNNELQNLDSAGAAYRRFVQQFPNHELALSAQFELSTLGKEPKDLLPPNDLAADQPASPRKAQSRSHK